MDWQFKLTEAKLKDILMNLKKFVNKSLSYLSSFVENFEQYLKSF